MTKTVTNAKNKTNNINNKEVRSIANYVRSHGATRSNDLTTDSNGGVLVPTGLAQASTTVADRRFQLSNLVNVTPVSVNKGDFPILSPNAYAVKKDELAKYSDIDSGIQTVPFKINTYAAKLSISDEILQDSEFPLTPLLAKQMGTVAINTKNKLISDEMNKVQAENISSLDDLITAIEGLDPRFQTGIYMDQKSYAKIRTMKDKNGDYIVNDSTNTLLNIPVTVLPAYLGLNGIFVGDLKNAITVFSRFENSLQYQMNGSFGTALCLILRLDAELTNSNVLKHLTFSDNASGATK